MVHHGGHEEHEEELTTKEHKLSGRPVVAPPNFVIFVVKDF